MFTCVRVTSKAAGRSRHTQTGRCERRVWSRNMEYLMAWLSALCVYGRRASAWYTRVWSVSVSVYCARSGHQQASVIYVSSTTRRLGNRRPRIYARGYRIMDASLVDPPPGSLFGWLPSFLSRSVTSVTFLIPFTPRPPFSDRKAHTQTQ